MKSSLSSQIVLAVSGLVAVAVGVSILFFPHALNASMGVPFATDINVINEMKAPAGLILAGGFFALYAMVRGAFVEQALRVMTIVYLAYGLSRMVSLVVDGIPNALVLEVMGFELALGVICGLALWLKRPVARVAM